MMTESMEEVAPTTLENARPRSSKGIFSIMADYPWPFLVILPIAFILLIAFGWMTNDKIEQEVANLWIAQEGSYARDQAYAKTLDVDDMPASSLAAMAIPRDGGNIMNATRLEEIRARMEAAEGTMIQYKGDNYTWDDLCYTNPAPYRFPCLRLSPMDLFQEARWTFDSPVKKLVYYQSVIKDALLNPRLPRFGVMQTLCQKACAFVLTYRMVIEPDPLALFGDIGSLEYNDPCRICMEENYTATIETTHANMTQAFGILHQAVEAARENATDPNLAAQLRDIGTKLEQLIVGVTKDDVVDFYTYYVARDLYAKLGVPTYLSGYALFTKAIEQCLVIPPPMRAFLRLACPPHPSEMNATTAEQHLLNHADGTFSSVTTSGAPMPFWSEPDGTGFLFQPNNETGELFPVSGSGIDMSAPIDSLGSYLMDLFNSSEPADINSQSWQDQVETNPLYAWFMASLTLEPEGTICGNGNLAGTTGLGDLDNQTAELLAANTARWCTPFDIPNAINPGTGKYSKQHFARMWYDRLMDSILDIVRGVDDPYSWTTGAGCNYTLGGERYSYANQTDQDILHYASRLVYNIDEGASLGAIDRSLLIGGASPPIGEYNFDNPLQKVMVFQTLYASLVAKDIPKRVCQRPKELGGPVEISQEDAKVILRNWKEAMEDNWNAGWNNESHGQVQFVSFFDDGGGSIGSTGRMLNEMTLDNKKLMAISIVVIAVFSAMFLFSFDAIQSRVLLTLCGVGLVVLSFFAGVGFGLLTGIKINVTIAWTLPFVIIGLGVDDVYIILLAIKKQGGYTKRHWMKAVREVAVPVTMTSLVNASMFAIMNLSDIPAIYLTSRVACYCIIALYLTVMFCFPAYCYLDLKRQEMGRYDVLFCLKKKDPPAEVRKEDFRNVLLYDKFYKPLVLSNEKKRRSILHFVMFAVSAALVGVGAWGVTQRQVGLGLEDFFPDNNPAGRWATIRTGELASWSIGMNWGALEYSDPDVQMGMIKQFEDVVATPNVAEVDTKQLWMANFAIWTSRHCDNNFARTEFEELRCGRDQMFEDGTYCAGSWVENTYGLREKVIRQITNNTCTANEGGICRPRDKMHPDDITEFGLDTANATRNSSYCPVISNWTDKKWQFCMRRWRSITGSTDRFVLKEENGRPTGCGSVYNGDQELVWPLPYSEGPTMFSIDLFSHQITLEMMSDTRKICDYDPDLHCWMSGIPFDYWSQYENVYSVLLKLAGWATLAGFGVAWLFLFAELMCERNHPTCKILAGSFIGALAIAVTILLTLVTVVGLSILVGVNLTGFSNFAFILSVGFTVEYSVHIVSRWMRAGMDLKTSLDRVEYTMSFLMLPTFMSFVSSTIGVACLAFTEFEFNRVFFFKPLMIMMFVAYWFGCWSLPMALTHLDLDAVKLGKPAPATSSVKEEPNSVELA